MVKTTLTRLNCFNELQKKKNDLINIFSGFYGMEKYHTIKEKIENAIFIGYVKKDDYLRLLDNLEGIISGVINEKLLNTNKTSLTKEELFDNLTYKYIDIIPLEYLSDFFKYFSIPQNERYDYILKSVYENYKRYFNKSEIDYEFFRTMIISRSYDELQLPSWLKDTLSYYSNTNITDDILEKKFQKAKELLNKELKINLSSEINLSDGKTKNLIELCQNYEIAKNEYYEYLEKYQEYFTNELDIEEKTNKINNSLYEEFVLNNGDLILPHKKHELENFKNNSNSNHYIYELFGYSLISYDLISAFSSEAEELLKKGLNDFRSRSIKEDRIKYFKLNNIDLGDNYEDYINNDEAQKIIIPSDMTDKFVKEKEKYRKKAEKECFDKINIFANIINEMNKYTFLSSETFDAQHIENKETCIMPSVIQDNTFMREKYQVCIDFSKGNELDHNIIHEINHLYEAHCQAIDDKNSTFISGWDIVSVSFDDIPQDDSKRKYELFNEIINEKITQEILKMMQRNQTYIFGNQESFEIEGTTSYEHTSFLVDDFFEEFRDDILASRQNGNIDIIYNSVGKDNFDALNDLFSIFYENFNGFKIYDLNKELNSKLDTPNTRIFYDLINKRNKVLANMKEYNQLHFKGISR